MPKKEVDKERHYKNIIDKQKRIIQDLKKKIGRADKIEERYADIEEREAELVAEQENFVPAKQGPRFGCPNCSSELEVSGGERRSIYYCYNCGYRASKKTK